jgi:hypothetical protein
MRFLPGVGLDFSVKRKFILSYLLPLVKAVVYGIAAKNSLEWKELSVNQSRLSG